MVESSIDEGNGVAMLVMNRPSLSLEMNEAISSSIKSIETNYPKVQSVVLASSNPTIFSAGLDVQNLLDPIQPDYHCSGTPYSKSILTCMAHVLQLLHAFRAMLLQLVVSLQWRVITERCTLAAT